jgi:hypothetical protein
MTRQLIRGGIGACVAAVALLATGCQMENTAKPSESASSVASHSAADALAQLKALPSLEDTKTQVQNAMTEITTAAAGVVPEIQWLSIHGEDTGNCESPYEQTDGKRLFLPDSVAEGARISEPQWTTILAAATASATKIGATEVQVMKDQPGNHDVWFSGPTGISIKVAYHGNLVVSGYTGCRLPQNKR